MSKYRLPIFILAVLVLGAGIVWGYRRYSKKQAKNTQATEMAAPDNAINSSDLLYVKVPNGIANQTLKHTAYISYFNTKERIPNCVIYDISATEIAQCDAPGAEKRKGYNFEADPMCSASPTWADYKNTGYDRGHMAPANDMKWSPTTMAECFYMTNMCPQLHELNDGCWKKLELAIHKWTKRDKRLIVAAGPVLKTTMTHIGPDNDIAVPGAFFKVIYAPNQGRAIAFIFNNEKIYGSYSKHVVSVDYVERMTGLDFFSAVDDKLENQMEANSNFSQWGSKSDE